MRRRKSTRNGRTSIVVVLLVVLGSCVLWVSLTLVGTNRTLRNNSKIHPQKHSKTNHSSWSLSLCDTRLSTSPPPNHTPNTYHLSDHHVNTTTTTRLWGCHLTQTPLIVVHLHKTGGGSLRRQLAHAAHDYRRGATAWQDPSRDNSFYPIPVSEGRPEGEEKTRKKTTKNATFCNSGHYQFLPRANHWSYEGTKLCRASTPIGLAVACPTDFGKPAVQTNQWYCHSHHPQDTSSTRFDSANTPAAGVRPTTPLDWVYVGHNGVGSELHWLPAHTLAKWWHTHYYRADPPPTDNDKNNKNNINRNNHSSCIIPKNHSLLHARRALKEYWPRLDGHHSWCDNLTRPLHPTTTATNEQHTTTTQQQEAQRTKCRQELEQQVDRLAKNAILGPLLSPSPREQQDGNQIRGTIPKPQQQDTATTTFRTMKEHDDDDMARGQAWSHVYASLPVLRVVVLRHPFAWFASTFAWHSLYSRHGMDCDNVTHATFGAGNSNIYLGMNSSSSNQKDRLPVRRNRPPRATTATNRTTKKKEEKNWLHLVRDPAPGWMRRLALDHVYQLCGSDCRVRHLEQEATLTELVAQAQGNLQQGFCVVGILEHGMDALWSMMTRRIQYLNNNNNKSETNETETLKRRWTTTNNRTRTPKRIHESISSGEYGRCKTKFQTADFQQQVLNASPEVRALMHLYQVALEVNHVQQHELQQCSSSS